jgi:hypothetical protein
MNKPDKLIKITEDGLVIMHPGDTVLYIVPQSPGNNMPRTQKGIILSIADDEHAFVVYDCGGEWLNYQDYTAAKTNVKQLVLGWGW